MTHLLAWLLPGLAVLFTGLLAGVLAYAIGYRGGYDDGQQAATDEALVAQQRRLLGGLHPRPMGPKLIRSVVLDGEATDAVLRDVSPPLEGWKP